MSSILTNSDVTKEDIESLPLKIFNYPQKNVNEPSIDRIVNNRSIITLKKNIGFSSFFEDNMKKNFKNKT